MTTPVRLRQLEPNATTKSPRIAPNGAWPTIRADLEGKHANHQNGRMSTLSVPYVRLPEDRGEIHAPREPPSLFNVISL